MTRNLKTLGLILVAALAMSAVAASGASAERFVFTAETEHSTLKGAQLEASTITVDGGSVSCEKVKYEETLAGEASLDVTMIPTFEGCTFSGIPVEVDTNGCGYLFQAATKEGSNYEGKASIVCAEAEKSIVLTAKLFGTGKCTVHIGEQEGLENVTFVEEGSPAELRADIELSGIEYDQTAGTGLSACSGAENTGNGTYAGAVSVESFEGATQKKLQAKALKQTIDMSANPIKIGNNAKDKAKVTIENLLNEEVQLSFSVFTPRKTLASIDKCQSLKKKGDPGSTCEEEIECVTPSKIKQKEFGIITSPLGAAVVTVQGCDA